MNIVGTTLGVTEVPGDMGVEETLKGAVAVNAVPRKETVDWSSLTEGLWTISYLGSTTTTLAYNISGADVKFALEAIDGSASSATPSEWTHSLTGENTACTSDNPGVVITQTQAWAAVVPAVNEVQTIIFTNPGSGTYTLSFDNGATNATTGSLGWNVAAGTVETALNAIGSISGTGSVAVGDNTGGGFLVTFLGGLGGVDVNLLVGDAAALIYIAAVDEVHTWTNTRANAGAYTISFDSGGNCTTVMLSWNANDATVESALETLTSIGAGNIAASGTWGSRTLTFGGALGGQPITPNFTWDDNTVLLPTAGQVEDGVWFGNNAATEGEFTHTTDFQAKTDSVLISAISATIVALGSTITATTGGTHVDGNYDPMAVAVFPAEANTSTVETDYGPTGANYHGALDLTLYQLKTTSVLISAISDSDVALGATITATSGGTHVDGSFTHTADYTLISALVIPAAGKVDTTQGDFGIPGSLVTPTLDMTLRVLKTDVVGTTSILFGVARFTGGATGVVTLPNTDGSTSDASLVKTTGHFGANNATAGTYDVAAALASAASTQLSTDQANVATHAAYLLSTRTALGTLGTLAVAKVLTTATDGTYVAAAASIVKKGEVFGPASGLTGTYEGTIIIIL